MKKYSVYDAVWLAAALLTIEKYNNDPSVNREGIFLKQADIVHLAESLSYEKVDPARVSWWATADIDESTRNFFRADSALKPSARRLSMLEEFPEKTHPEGLDPTGELILNGKQYTIEELLAFMQETYPEILKRTDEEYDVQAIMNMLKQTEEMDPDQHDGCYPLHLWTPLFEEDLSLRK